MWRANVAESGLAVLMSKVRAALPFARFGSPTQRISRSAPTPPAKGKETDARLFRRRRGAVKTTRERAEEKRQEKLAYVRQQLENGSLVIRQMTDAERLRYPPRPTPPQRWAR
jgi:hypothetical protein